MPDPLTLATLADRYRIDRELGRGGMAIVYLAQDLRHERPVALKLLRSEVVASLDVDRFRREIAFAARLQHPHICSVYDSGDADGRPWFTMPYVRGESLRERLRREGRLPITTTLRITREVAGALAYAHREGVVHRDVKPENILLTEDGVTLLADFGIARPLAPITGEHLTEAGQSVGTPMYMAPEQAMSEPVDHRADQFALAAVCYEMLGGSPPHAGTTVHTVIARRVTTPVPRVRTLRADVSEATERALARALSIAPADRFDSIADFARALTDLRVSGSKRRRVPRAAWIGLATISTLLGATLALRRSGAPDPAATLDATPAAAPVRLAVLPFENLGDSADAYFADGMADELRGKLASLPGLEVIARASSSQYQDRRLPAAEVGRELGARYLLTGTVQWVRGPKRNRVRVRPELIEAASGVTRWAEPFDAAFTDVFDVQARIAGQVAESLHLALTDAARDRLAAAPTRSLTAYARFLRSREIRAGEISPDALRAAIAELRTATSLDSNFAAAWADLALVQVDAFRLGGLRIPDADTARDALARARALAPASPDVLGASGRYRLVVEGDFTNALKDYRAALRLAPHRSDLRTGAATAEMELDRYPEAVADLEEAVRLDPRSPDAAGALAAAYFRLREYPAARAAIERARRLRPGSVSLAYVQARIAAGEGDLAALRATLRGVEATAGPRAVAAYVALREDLIWALEDDQLRTVTTLTPDDLDGGRADWALAVAEAYRLLGSPARSRAYADTAVAAYTEMLNGWGTRRDRGQVVATRALALAHAGRMREAIAEADSAGQLQPLGSGVQGPYVAYTQARAYALAGERRRAADRLRAILAHPAHVSRGWIGIDRTLAEVRP